MLLILDDEHKEHLTFLNNVPLDVVKEFCRISVEFLKTGKNVKIFHTAAQKLNVDVQTVHHGVEGLMFLLMESAKMMPNEVSFEDSLVPLGFSPELRSELLSVYMEHRDLIRHLLSHMCISTPHYHDLEWRFDVQLATRTLRHQVSPQVVLKFHLDTDTKKKTVSLQTDPVNLIHLTRELEAALTEAKSAHCRRIFRNI